MAYITTAGVMTWDQAIDTPGEDVQALVRIIQKWRSKQ